MSNLIWKVRLTDRAEADVDDALRWFHQQSADSAAARWFRELMNRISTLEMHPERCPVAPESADLGLEIRELLFGKRQGVYRILFRIERRTVLILRIWHAARGQFEIDDR